MINKEQSFFDKNRRYLYRMVPLDTPFSANIEVSSVCNIKCKYCLHSLGNSEGNNINIFRNMKPEEFENIMCQFSTFPHKLKKLVINGVGEPLCNPHFLEILAIAKRADIAEKVEFFTNAILLTPELSEKIIATGVDRIKVSLQGLSEQKYKDVCGKSINYASFYDNLKYLALIKGRTELFIKIIDIGLDNDYSSFLDQFSFADCLFTEHVQPWFEEVDYNGIIKKRNDDNITNKYGEIVKPPAVCPIPFYRLYISCVGDVFYCYSIRRPVQILNCFENQLIDIWNGNQRKEFLRLQLQEGRSWNQVCKNCSMMCDAAFSEQDSLDDHTEEVLSRL